MVEETRDPEGIEAKHLRQACQLAGKEVLEIGCGSGWLTWQFASATKRTIGIDPDLTRLQEAKADQPIGITNVSLAQAEAETLPFRADSFDIAVFSNSL